MMQYSQNLCLTGTPILIFWILLDGLLIGGALLLGAIALWRWREGRSWRHWQQMQADLQQANAKLQQETCDRQQVEAALRDSATWLSLALKAAKAGTWQWDQASNQAIWSEENFRLLGYDPQDCEACYENWLRAVHPDDRATVNQHISQLMAEQHGLNLEYRVMWPDRTVRWLADIGEITYDPDGNPTGMIGIQIDITNRKQAELALAESESQQRLILENIPSFIAKVNREAEILFLNRLAPGFTPEQVIGQSLDLFTAPESREPQRAALAEVFATGQTVTLESHGTGAHGQPAFYEVRIAPIEAAGQIDAAIIVATDISDRKQAELALVQLNQALESRVQERTAALQESESRFRQLAETIQQVFWLFDPNSHQNLYVSPAYEQIWGQPLETVYASEWSWVDAIHLDDRDRILTLFTNSLTWAHDVEYRIIRPDGTMRWIHDRSFPIRDSEGQIYRVARIARDITEHKLVEESLRDRLAFERLIASISTHFVNLNLDDLDAGITDALEQITQFFGVDYSYVVLFSADRSVGYKTYEWLQPGLPPFSEEWDAIPAAPFPWWMDKITHFEPIVIDDRDDLPAAASNERAALEATGIRSLTALSVSYSKILMGYIGFATINRCHSWQKDTITLLQLVGELFANALQRKQAETRLREQQARLNLALEAANMGIWEANLLTGEEILSPQAEALLGFAPGTFDGRRESFLHRVHPDDLDSVQQSDRVALQTGRLQDEFRVVLPDQTIRWIYCLGKVFYDEAGTPTRIVGVDLDITERKLAEITLRVRAQQQAAVAQLGQLALAETDLGVVMDTATALVAESLGVEYCKVLELLPDGTGLLLRAGVGWQPGLVGQAIVGMNQNSQASYTLAIDEPVIVEDLLTDPRFNGPTLLREHQVVSGLSVVIHGSDRPFGVLGAHSTQQRCFTQDDANFLQAVANILATAIARKRVEESLQNSEAELRALFAAMTDVVTVRDIQGRCLKIPPTNASTLYRPVAEMLGQTTHETFPAAQAEIILNGIQTALAAHQTIEIDYSLEIGERMVWFAATVSPLTADSAVIVARDISDRKRAEEALRQSETRFRQLAENIQEVFWMADVEFTQILYVSPAYETIWGRTCASLYENPASFADAIHPEDYDRALAVIRQQPHQGWDQEYRIIQPNGTLRWIWEQAFPVIDHSGQIDRVVGICQDISDRKAAEAALAESQKQYQNLAENSPDIIERFDLALRHQYVSPSLTDLTGIPEAEFLGKTCRDLGMDENMVSTWEAAAMRLLATKQKQVIEFDMLTLNGIRSFEMAIVPEFSNQQTLESILCISRDITDHKRAELEIRQLNEALEQQNQNLEVLIEQRTAELTQRTIQLEASNQELESFSYSVSHDLRAPLRHINGFVNVLQQHLQNHQALSDPKVVHYLQVIESSSQKMASLIDGLLTLSRIGRKAMTSDLVSLRALVDEAIALVQSHSETASSVEFAIGKLPTVQGDSTLLQQVFSNLINNAVKFSRNHPAPRIEIGSLPDGTLFVKDNGVGFQMEYADKLFGAFQRLHSQAAFEGSGIGLAIVQRIIHRHGGIIWAESSPNQGATFYFTIGSQ